MKNTVGRQFLLEILNTYKKPVSASEIYQEIIKKFPDMAKSTIYRNLNSMNRAGILKMSVGMDRIAKYELISKSHIHYLTCLLCSEKVAFEDCPVNILEETIYENTGFEVINHNLQFFGYCSKCKSKK